MKPKIHVRIKEYPKEVIREHQHRYASLHVHENSTTGATEVTASLGMSHHADEAMVYPIVVYANGHWNKGETREAESLVKKKFLKEAKRLGFRVNNRMRAEANPGQMKGERRTDEQRKIIHAMHELEQHRGSRLSDEERKILQENFGFKGGELRETFPK